MKRHHALVGAAVIALSGIIAACSGDVLQAEEPSINPYQEDASALVAGIVRNSVRYVSSYSGTKTDPGRLLLQSMNAYRPEVVDLDVETFNEVLIDGRRRAAKGGGGHPFGQASDLSDQQKRYLKQVWEAAERAGSQSQLRTSLTAIEHRAEKKLSEEALKPIYVVTATLQAQYAYFMDPGNAPEIRRLAYLLKYKSGADSAGPRFLRIQDTTDTPPNGYHPDPPSIRDYFGEIWQGTLRDTREVAELGVLGGAGIGCAAGFLPAGPVSCSAGAAVGGFIGGLGGVVFGGIASAVANYAEAASNLEDDEDSWCADQSRLPSSVRSQDYNKVCEGPDSHD